MKLKTCFIFLLVLCFAIPVPAQSETIVYYGGIDKENKGYQDFHAAHPKVLFEQSEIYYETTAEFIGSLLTKEFSSDLFDLYTNLYDYQRMMKKGYCVDLSNSAVIQDAIGRMHPLIAAQTMCDGKIYAVPNSIAFYYTQIDQEGWAEAGLTEEDIPDSFPAFLDFLESWCDRIDASQEKNIRLILSWDMTVFNEYSYTGWLVNLLLDSYIMQVQFAGEPLRFNSPELSALLERCKTIGARITEVEPRIQASGGERGDYQLFEDGLQSAWPQKASDMLCFRLNDAQPKIIKASLSMYAINPNSVIPDLCIELLEKLVVGPENPSLKAHTLLYQGAEPMINPNYEEDLAHWTARVAKGKEQLEKPDLDFEKRSELEDQLRYDEDALSHTQSDAGKYYMSPAQLEDYNTYVDALYFPPPSALNTSMDSLSVLWTSQEQYAAGLLSTDQFLGQLDRIARTIELEDR